MQFSNSGAEVSDPFILLGLHGIYVHIVEYARGTRKRRVNKQHSSLDLDELSLPEGHALGGPRERRYLPVRHDR